jgi:hypothetical protein
MNKNQTITGGAAGLAEHSTEFMLSALLVAEATLSAYGEHSPALAVIREAIARATIAGCPADSVAMDWQNDLESFPRMD